MVKVVFSLFLMISGIIHPESTFYTPATGLFISEIGRFNYMDGKIIHVRSLTNPKAEAVLSKLMDPKGITLYQNKLWIADVKRLLILDIRTNRVSSIKGKLFSPHPEFLNDICQVNNSIYVSDTKKNVVYKVKGGKAIKTLSIQAPNGISYNNNTRNTYIATFTKPGRILQIKGKSVKKIYESTSISGADGLTLWKQKHIIFVSGFLSGNILAISLKDRKIVGSIYDLSNPADIFFSEEQKILFVPEMGKNRILIYKVSIRGS